MNNSINNETLELARQLRKLTQKDVAEAIGITQGTLSKAEHGLQDLDNSVLSKLSELYNVPIDFFYQETDKTQISHFYYRKRLTSNKVLDSFISLVRIFKMFIEDILSPIELPEYSLESLAPSENLSVQEIADRTRYMLGVHRGPIPNLVTLLENHGIIIVKIDFGTDKLDGLTTITQKGRRLIFLNSQMSSDRIRFSLAHELGHLIMHLDTLPKPEQDVEQEANDFAAEFLMPNAEIELMLHGINLYDLVQLKRKWKVSVKALLYRAKSLETISSNDYRNLQILYSKKGYNKSEPFPLSPEVPTLLNETIKLYKNELGYTDTDLIKLMHIGDQEYSTFFVKPILPKLNINFFKYRG